MTRVTLVMILLSSFFSIQAQKFFSGNGDYSVLLNENVAVKHVDVENGFADSYILRESGSFSYMVSITKVKPRSITLDTVYTKKYKQSYLSECGCKIVDSKDMDTENFKGVRFTIEADVSGSQVKGFSLSTVRSGFLFTVNFIAPRNKFDSYSLEYDKIVRSLRIR